MAAPEMSFETCFGGAGFDLYAWQRCFPDRVAAYFAAVPVAQIMLQFGVTERTAMNWKGGIVVPSGDKIAQIVLQDPVGFSKHFAPDGRAA